MHPILLLPPPGTLPFFFPFPRIDNFSEVAISYYQTGVQEESMRSVVKPHHSLPYAWDEPTLQPHLGRTECPY